MAETPTALRVVITSDNFLARKGLACLLGGVKGIEVRRLR
jgi:hypothetical protein